MVEIDVIIIDVITNDNHQKKTSLYHGTDFIRGKEQISFSDILETSIL